MNEKSITHLSQTVQTHYGHLQLMIGQESDNVLLATASLNEDIIAQWHKAIDPEKSASKNDIQGLKKQALEAIKRDESTQRKLKLTARRQSGVIAFPNQVARSHTCAQLQQQFAHDDKADLDKPEMKDQLFSLCGRLMSKRMMGKVGFAQLQDGDGMIQLYFTRETLSEQFNECKQLDTGDVISVTGFAFRTETGELTLHCEKVALLTKALNPLPDKFHGLKDIEQRYRQRYVDLLCNEESRQVFITRANIIKAIRHFFEARDFMEVETPMLHPIPGGASARPFNTHHNALDIPLYLRIAPELYLKRLIVGGFERVYEMNRNFRNEGLSTRHNPEFSMLEFYQAYADYKQLMDLTEHLFQHICHHLYQTETITYQDHHIDFSQPFQRLTLKEAILKQHPQLEKSTLEDLTLCKVLANNLGIDCGGEDKLGKVITEIFEQTVESTLIQPTFITEYPIEVSPLARVSDDNPNITDRFELFIAGREIANGFSELNDAEEQAERFKLQVQALECGDDEAMHFDADYINALKYGMPPTAGEGIGIDRLVMLFTNTASIRDVLLFPHMRPVQ